jgi:polyphenol oxidase
VNAPQDLALEAVDDFATFGVRAFTTGRAAGSFGMHSAEPVAQVTARWAALRQALAPLAPRLATAGQVHGARVVVHGGGWEGWLRVDAADGHASTTRGTAMAVSVADCVPVFLAHPSGAAAVLHSGWRGTAARIVEEGIRALEHRGLPAGELRVHLGPAICGRCYEVSADVYERVSGRSADGPRTIDLRALIADHARAAGVRHITSSPLCTRCDNDQLYSHRAGDEGRQLGVIVAA